MKNQKEGVTLSNNFEDALKNYLGNGSKFEGDNVVSGTKKSKNVIQETVVTPIEKDMFAPGFAESDDDVRQVCVTDDQGLKLTVEGTVNSDEEDQQMSDEDDGDLECRESDGENDSTDEDEKPERRLPVKRNLFENKNKEVETINPKVKSKVVAKQNEISNTKASTIAEFERLKQLPDVQKFLQLMNKDGDEVVKKKSTEAKKNSKKRKLTPLNKSPSDSTVYTPALKQKRFPLAEDYFPHRQVENVDFDDQISQCIDDLRLRDFPDDMPAASSMTQQVDRQEKAKARANEILLEAERRKAAIVAPTGNDVCDNNKLISLLLNALGDSNNNKQKETVVSVPPVDLKFSDDQAKFNNSTCHIDVNVKQKIGRGRVYGN